MVIKPSRFEKKIRILERIRADIARKIDQSYVQNNVSDLLALEEKYESIMSRISRLRLMLARLKKSKRSMN